MTLDDLIAIEQIRRIFADYCHRFDDDDLDGWQQLFADDVTLTVGRTGHEGRAAAREWAESIKAGAPEASRHHINNVAVDVSGASATVLADFILVGADRQIAAAGRYQDRLEQRDGSWQIVEHRLSFLRPNA